MTGKQSLRKRKACKHVRKSIIPNSEALKLFVASNITSQTLKKQLSTFDATIKPVFCSYAPSPRYV